eukprot:TRINITY_DN3011_c0_g1_i2.p1 TRINITY_DN3011_c0_g1~~TRINITY_DN3011_c0_g1_i2.p1  ORF type:complete len:111 (-),score=15.59 TRINITY_DN3011_c0_g1_i2:129-461(-)
MHSNKGYLIVVVEDINQKLLVGSGSLVLERKFIHDGGLCGHIEDVVVLDSVRGTKVGRVIVEQLTHLGKRAGCYKIILDCSEKNVGFYHRLGFQRKENQMAMYFDQPSKL